jgi:hypothetical protein
MKAGAGNNVAGAVYSSGTNGFVNSATVRPYDVFINRAITYMAPTTAGVSIALQASSQYVSSAETAAATANSFVGGSLTYTGVKNLTASYAYARVGINGTAVVVGVGSTTLGASTTVDGDGVGVGFTATFLTTGFLETGFLATGFLTATALDAGFLTAEKEVAGSSRVKERARTMYFFMMPFSRLLLSYPMDSKGSTLLLLLL